MTSRMEMIYIGNGDQAYKTGIGAICDTNAETWKSFKSAKAIEVPMTSAVYLIDYYNSRGDLTDSIGLDRKGFEFITGKRARGPAHYKKVDAKFWDRVRVDQL